ncbi:MAG: tetratricopeptide repeat protein [Candidatus Omnitrophota bacterium]
MKINIRRFKRFGRFPVMALVLWLIIWASSSVMAENFPNDRFDRANRLYEEGKYSEALNVYQTIGKTISHWKLFYNMGNCYYKLNQPVRAKIYLLKARSFEPFNLSIQKNIDIINRQLNDKIPYPKPDFLRLIAMKIEAVLSLNLLSVILLIGVFGVNGVIFLWVMKGRSRLIAYGVSFALLFVLIFGVYHIYRVEKFNRRDVAVITGENSQLRSGPGENNTVLFKVNPGLEVKIIDRSRDWFQVSASSEIAGWIERENLEPI